MPATWRYWTVKEIVQLKEFLGKRFTHYRIGRLLGRSQRSVARKVAELQLAPDRSVARVRVRLGIP